MSSSSDAINGKKRELKITFEIVRDKNIEQLRTLNNVIFPIKYADSFYKQCLNSGETTQLACYNDIAIGAIACRLEKQKDSAVKLYLMTVGVLAPYRGMGVGSRLVKRALKYATGISEIKEAYLHVQTSNEDAIKFYESFGFEVKETVENYYENLEPSSAVILVKTLVPKENKDT